GCSGPPVPWGQGAERPPGAARGGAPVSMLYPPDTSGPPLVWSVHNGGHEWPPQATANIVQFFKEQALAAAPPTVDPPAAVDTSASVVGTGTPGSSGDGGSAA